MRGCVWSMVCESMWSMVCEDVWSMVCESMWRIVCVTDEELRVSGGDREKW